MTERIIVIAYDQTTAQHLLDDAGVDLTKVFIFDRFFYFEQRKGECGLPDELPVIDLTTLEEVFDCLAPADFKMRVHAGGTERLRWLRLEELQRRIPRAGGPKRSTPPISTPLPTLVNTQT